MAQGKLNQDIITPEALLHLGFKKQDLQVRIQYPKGNSQDYDHTFCFNDLNVFVYFTHDNSDVLLDICCAWVMLNVSGIGLNQLKGILYYTYLSLLCPPEINKDLFKPLN
jgi:hypothetical protein